MCNIDAGIKKLKEFLNIRQAINPTASGEYISFFQMKEILEAMRKPSQGQDPCKVPVETVGFPENVVKTWLTTCQKIHQDTIFIDRKVAEEWIKAATFGNGVPKLAEDFRIYNELKRALGEKI